MVERDAGERVHTQGGVRMQRTRLEPQLHPTHEWKHEPRTGEEICTRCHAIYNSKHWSLDEEAWVRLNHRPNVPHVLCPACRMIMEKGQYEGQITLRLGDSAEKDRQSLLNLLHNEETRAMGKNPLSRLDGLRVTTHLISVNTTTESLARRIGREVEKAFHGHTEIQQLPGERFVRVVWSKE